MKALAAALLAAAALPAGPAARLMAQQAGEATARVPHGIGSWPRGELGNHRAVISVDRAGDAVWVRIPWRRPDAEPEAKAVIFADGRSGELIANALALSVTRARGEFVFQPVSGPGRYYAYYLPYEMKGHRAYPRVSYRRPRATAQEDWLRRHGLAAGGQWPPRRDRFPAARVLELQAIDAFDSFDPMEVIATPAEVAGLLARHPSAPYLLFCEDREHPVRMRSDLPLRWLDAGPARRFRGAAARGEFYAFQVALWAARSPIADLEVRFESLRSEGEAAPIPASALRCWRCGGRDWRGRSFRRRCAVARGQVQALWMGVQVPLDAAAGTYRGAVTIAPGDKPASTVALVLEVRDEILADGGDSDPARHSRLRWLDSSVALDEEVVAPFTPLEVEQPPTASAPGAEPTIACLGRSVTLSPAGLPARITSFFAPEVTHLRAQGRALLARPIELRAIGAGGRPLEWSGGGVELLRRAPDLVTWKARRRAAGLALEVRGRMESEGYLGFELTLRASAKSELDDVRLELVLPAALARYMMGMGVRGGRRPTRLEWRWDRSRNQDALWIGDVNAGLQLRLRDENYERPLNTNFYLLKPLNLPPSWWNGGRGGCCAEPSAGDTFTVSAFCGARTLARGETLHFDFDLLLTPFKPLDTDRHWRNRYLHAYRPVEEAAATGASVVNIHHASAINPFINYPFLRTEELRAYVASAHARGLQVKLYYTVRELSNHAPELFALRSLGEEIFVGGAGGGPPWLQEHLRGGYRPGWFVPRYRDAAVLQGGASRWHNYYLEGLRWLVANTAIDGIYIDDIAFDRVVMKRARKILARGRPDPLIDLHSANQYNPRDGFASSANLYLEHFPFIDRLWFGEYFDYDAPPDRQLIEISGIPFGLMGEMLQGGGNPWRGMVYGMTARLPSVPLVARLWRAWDAFGMQGARMVGYWSPTCPVRTGREDILATLYLHPGHRALIALASWAPRTQTCRLRLDWPALGLDAGRAELLAHAIEGFQRAARFAPTDPLPIEPGKGWLLVLRER